MTEHWENPLEVQQKPQECSHRTEGQPGLSAESADRRASKWPIGYGRWYHPGKLRPWARGKGGDRKGGEGREASEGASSTVP